MVTGSASRFAIRYGLVRKPLDTQAVFDGLYAASPASFWLDSSVAGIGSARFSFLGDDQGPLSETLICRDGAVTVRDRRGVQLESGQLLGILDARLADRRIGPTCLPFDFVGGYVGYFGSAPGPGCHDVPFGGADRPPDAMWMFADRVVAVDHQSDLTYVLAVEDGRAGVRAAADAWIVETMRRLQSLSSQQSSAAEPPAILPALSGQWGTNHLPGRYLQLRRVHPVPHAALLSFDEVVLESYACDSVVRTGSPTASGAGPVAANVARRLAPATEAGPTPVSAIDCLRRCLLAAVTAGAAEPVTDLDRALEPANRPVGLGYFGLAGGVDLSLVTPVPVPRIAAALRHPAAPLVGAAEPAA
jgi:hypothetical protein